MSWRYLDEAALRKRLLAMKGTIPFRTFARLINAPTSNIHQFLSGKRPPNKRILAALGCENARYYRKTNKP